MKKKRAVQGSRRRRPKRRPITPEDLLRFVWVADPQLAPDGGYIVFVRKHVGDSNQYVRNLWMVSSDGDGAPFQFTAGERDSQPRWSPDGSTIAFVSARDEHRPQIYTIAAGGGEARVLTSFPEGSIAGFTWSPDGDRLAVSFRPRAEEWTQEAKKEREAEGRSDPPRAIDDLWYRHLDRQKRRLLHP